MASFKRWTLRVLGGLLVVIVAAVGVLYVLSSRVMSRTYALREVALTLPTDSASLARGAHLVELSCRGCHTQSLAGRIMFEQPGVGRLVAPDVMARLATYSDAQFAGYMRYGVKKDGSSGFVMPPPGFYHMSDDDLAALLAYLRRQPAPPAITLPGSTYGPIGRLGMVLGEFPLAVSGIDTTVARVGADSTYRTARQGEYMARMICADCHGTRLTGDPATPSPSIAGAAGYNLAELTALLRTGTPRDPATKLTLMAEVANGTLKHLTDEEISAIQGYLATLPQTGVPGVK